MGASESSTANGTVDSPSLPIPETMKVVHLVSHVPSLTADAKEVSSHFEVAEVPIPELRAGEVLIKVECSPINPSDTSSLKGQYNAAQAEALPCQVGFEAAGTIVKTGGGAIGWWRLGSRVAVASKGGGRMWAEYAVAKAMLCVPLPDDVSFVEGCSVFVNPLTSLAFLEITQEKKHKAVVITAAASALGKMTIRLLKSAGIPYIALVRRQENLDAITADSGKIEHGFLTTVDGWEKEFKAAAEKINATVCFDAVAGDLVGTVLSNMPSDSTAYVYGGLSGKPASLVNPKGLIFSNKTLTGFWLTPYVMGKGLLQQKFFLDRAISLIKTDLRTEFKSMYPIAQVGEAISNYCNNMSGGKVCLSPWIQEKKDLK